MRWRPRGLRPAGADDLGLRHALAGWILPFLVAAMAFLASLSAGGVAGTAALARYWRIGAGAVLTVQVPEPRARLGGVDSPTRVARALETLAATNGVAQARALGDAEMADLLRPWLGRDAERIALPLPALIEVRLVPGAQVPMDLSKRLTAAVPGTLVEDHGPWLARLSGLAWSLQACALAVLALVAALAGGVIAVATRTGLAARRQAIEIIHGLGATDGYIAGRFARRAMAQTALGALIGTVVALPVLAGLADLARPLAGMAEATGPAWEALPAGFWFLLPGLPGVAALIGWGATQATVRLWLRRLP